MMSSSGRMAFLSDRQQCQDTGKNSDTASGKPFNHFCLQDGNEGGTDNTAKNSSIFSIICLHQLRQQDKNGSLYLLLKPGLKP